MVRQKRLSPDRSKLNAPWQYTTTDELILTYLARYRYLRGTTLHVLLNMKPGTVNYALRKLFDRRLIDKPKSQALGYNSLNDTDIYELTPRGAEHLTKTVPEATNLLRVVSDAPVKNFKHAMMICDALSSIEIGTRGTGCTFLSQAHVLAKNKHENPLKMKCRVRHVWANGKKQDFPTNIIPDGLFGIKYPDGQTRLFLLEAEHYNPLYPTTLERASFLKKVIAYADIRKTKTIQQLGKSNFNVVFIFPTRSRALHAADIVQELYGKSDLYLITHAPVQEEIWRSPRPAPELFTGTWLRGGLTEFSLKETPAV